MAGMDWFRWHHGSVTDPKFALVARKAGASVPDVLAVWAYILETASQSVERGDFGTVDCEALDCVFGFPAPETRTADILAALSDRGLTDGTRIAAWEKRQPKREREDATNADRQATFKAKQNQVTPDNANDNQKTPRVEESRVDKKEEGRRATRIPPNFQPNPEPEAEAGIDRQKELANFRDYWTAKAGKDAAKLDWQATWRQWVRKADRPGVSRFAKPAPNITVPSRQERDPELTRLDIERSRSVPMPQAIREQMQKLKLGVAA